MLIPKRLFLILVIPSILLVMRTVIFDESTTLRHHIQATEGPLQSNQTKNIFIFKEDSFSTSVEENHTNGHLPPRGRQTKKILIWNRYHNQLEEYWNKMFKRLREGQCPVNECEIVYSRSSLETADAVLFKRVQEDLLPDHHPEGQVWIFFSLEAFHSLDWRIPDEAKGLFNWTMTFHSFSDIVVPYGKVSLLPPHARNLSVSPENRNYWKEKNKDGVKVAWMVSHCNTSSNREAYVAELQKYIDVDIYGKCGEKKCAQTFTLARKSPENDECFQVINSYMFYLAFENSICTDYVTEKLFKILQLDVIPVVLGGVEYEWIAPPNSTINAMYFSPRQLAKFLGAASTDEKLYNSYFEWKGRYEVELGHPENPMICDLCAKLHGEPVFSEPKPWRRIEENREGKYTDLVGCYSSVDNQRKWDSKTQTLKVVPNEI